MVSNLLSSLLILGALGATECTAGRSGSKAGPFIIGESVPITKYPSTAAILIENQIWGAGAILSPNWIATTAFNCFWVDPSFITVRVGSSDWTTGGYIFSIEECIVHPQYKGLWDYNIALIKLNGKIKFSPSARKSFFPGSESPAGTPATVSGWDGNTGQTQLQAVSQAVLDEATCNAAYKLSNNSFCAQNMTASTCLYDFGAPLTKVFRKTKTRLIGLYQGSTNCSDPVHYPSVYTDVFYFVDWIKQTMKSGKEEE